MKTLYLVDYENSCQNFLKFSYHDDGYSYNDSTFEIVVFVAKSTNLDHLKLSKLQFVTVNHAETDGKEAADFSLNVYAYEKFISPRCDYNKYDKIWIVKGLEGANGKIEEDEGCKQV